MTLKRYTWAMTNKHPNLWRHAAALLAALSTSLAMAGGGYVAAPQPAPAEQATTVEQEAPAEQQHLRVATFNVALDQVRQPGQKPQHASKGELAQVLAGGQYLQAQKVAAIIREVNPDVVLLNEIDGNDGGQTVRAFVDGYLGGLYPYVVTPTCNTGVPSGLDLNGNGTANEPDDAYGFGWYDGQYCMALLSKYPVQKEHITTFKNLRWADLPGAQVPLNEDGTPFYSPAAWQAMRLSSKTHMDVPISVGKETIHLLAAHPTPPVFDGPEDRNGRRNFDEIGLWARYIDPRQTLPADRAGRQQGRAATLQAGDHFVILGDLNASPDEGDAFTNAAGQTAINQLLLHPLVHSGFESGGAHVPASAGGLEHARNHPKEGGEISPYAATHTAGWQMRADYVLPSKTLNVLGSGVFWPPSSDSRSSLVVAQGEEDVNSSDHRLVWVDLALP